MVRLKPPPTALKVLEFPATVWKGGIYFKLRCDLVQLIVGGALLMNLLVEYGPPVKCVNANKGYEDALKDQLDELCWTERIFTKTEENGETHQKPENLYNWITSLCLAQFAVMMAPYLMWVTIDGGALHKLTEDLNLYWREADQEAFDPKKVAHFLVEAFERKRSAGHIMWYFITEVATWVSTVVSMAVLDSIAETSFSGEGMNVFSHLITPLALRNDGLAEIFPVTVVCDFDKIGPSGGDSSKRTLCALPGNLMWERYCVMLWVLLLILLVTDTINIAYLVTCFCSKRIRYMLICGKAWKINQCQIKRVTEKLDFFTWFLLYEIGMQCNVDVFWAILDAMDDQITPTGGQEEWQDTEVKHTLGNSIGSRDKNE